MKFESLGKANSLINSIKEAMTNQIKEESKIIDVTDFIVSKTTNNDTYSITLNLKKNIKSLRMEENAFTRIICISGKLKISLPTLNEEILITPLNTQLIMPNTPYIIETLEPSEVMMLYKEKKKNVNYQIVEHKTIYNK